MGAARRFTALDHYQTPRPSQTQAERVQALEKWVRSRPAHNRRSISFGKLFLVGSAVTLGTALVLALDGHPVAAGALILASPFPCPPGMPC